MDTPVKVFTQRPVQPIPFEKQNVVIAKDQHPYLPLPGQMFGDAQGTLLTSWEVTDEDLEEIIRTRRVWVTTLTMGHPLQPFRLSSDEPVLERQPCVEFYDETHASEDLITAGWYFHDETQSMIFGPYADQAEAASCLKQYVEAINRRS